MTEATTKPRSSRSLSAALDSHTEIAAMALNGLNELRETRLHSNYPLLELRPSPENPRRDELDRAGVSREWIEELKLRDGEDPSDWTKRLDNHLDKVKGTLTPDSLKLVEEIFALAYSILKNGLLQPITASPDREILMGECRWTACLLSNSLHNQVIIRKFDPSLLKAIRFLENDKRSNLGAASTVMSVRMIIEDKIDGKCGFDNPEISINLIRDTFGAKTTKSAYYLSFCRLPEGDELLNRIYAGAYRGIRSAYEDCVKRIEDLKNAHGLQTPPLEPANGKTGQQQGKKQPPAYSNKYPPVKTRLPGTKGGKVLFQALSEMSGISEEAKSAFHNAFASWEAAPDTARKNIFAKTMNEFFELADPDENDKPETGKQDGAA